MIHIPEKFSQFLSPYGPVVHDSNAMVPVGFGHRIVGSLGESLWAELATYGKQVYDVEGRYWVFVTSVLSREEAVLTYGPVTQEEYGPRGGWRSVTFGNTKFTSKLMAPMEVQNKPKKARGKPKVDAKAYEAKDVLEAYQKLYGEKK